MGKPLFIDTDTASDDAVALMMAFRFRGPDIKALGVVAGNCPLEQATINALFIRDLCGMDLPVYQGADRPLQRPLETAQFVHGEDGMGDVGLVPTRLADAPWAPTAGHAADALIELAQSHEDGIELITLGPLTNIAIALSKAPWLAGRISRCFIMGGASDYYGNITPVSEYNIWADPEAAEAVFASRMPITMIGWDISRKYAVIDDDVAASLRQIGTPKAIVAVDCQTTLRRFCQEVSGLAGFDLPDPIAVAVALDEQVVVESFDAGVFVSTDDGLTRGQTILDDRSMTDRPRNVRVVSKASRERFMALLREGLT